MTTTLAREVERPAVPLWEAAGRWRGVGVAIGILALTRVVQILFVLWLDAVSDAPTGLRSRLLIWDAGWFVKVATEGYPHTFTYGQSGRLVGNGLAFFPLYPMLIRSVAVTGLDAATAGLVVAALAAVGAAVALHLLGSSLYGRRAGWALVAICCSAPASVVLSMGYSEGLFLALVAGTLAAAHRRVWWAAGLLGLGASLTRPTGIAVAVALAVAAALALRDPAVRRDGRWQPIVATVVALAGAPAYLGWVGWRVGVPDAWFTIQSQGWGTSFDFGRGTARFLGTALTNGDGWVPISIALLLIVAAVSAGIALNRGVWAPLALYGVLSILLVYGQAGYYHSKPRLLLPVILTLVPAVLAAARARTVVAVLSIVAWGLFGLWYGAYLIVVWPYTL